MNKFHILIPVLAITLGLGGCASMSREQQGAVGGATAGGVVGGAIGGIIGNRSGNAKEGAVIGGAAGAVLGAIIGQRMNQQKEELEQVPGVERVEYDEQQQTIDMQMQIFFDFDKYDIKVTEAVKLQRLGDVFRKYPENIVVIEGHTDSQGTDAYNLALSRNRAASVEIYLRQMNLNIASLSSVGYGESQPIADNMTEAGRAQNRRVEIKITADPNRVPQQQTPVSTTPTPQM